jgi:hypothetical protein
LIAANTVQWIIRDQQRTVPVLGEVGKGHIDVVFAARKKNLDLLINVVRGRPYVIQMIFGIRVLWIAEDRKDGERWDKPAD